ncbi:MAG: DUF4349 domain-containing protein [Actinobacteria bacterium]|nr:DUF4349 domain-containing protein [Actinomycetota bacterium]
MSQRDLGDPRFQEIVNELRQKAPPAPEGLRERVGATARSEGPRTVGRRWNLGLRHGLALAAATAVTLGIGAALINGLNGSGDQGGRQASPDAETLGPAGPWQAEAQKTPDLRAAPGGAEDAARGDYFPALPPARRRLQDYDARMRLRVKDAAALDRATKRAMRDTRALGGFVASIDFGTRPEDQGDANLVLRVPVARVQEAVARYTELGTIVSQQVKINDLQPQADRLSQSATELRRRIAELVAKSRRSGLTVDERVQLENARRDLQSLTGRRSRLVREASYATVTLELTTSKAAEKREVPGAFRTFWDDASKILGTELIWLLYALVVAGPFVLLAILALVAERSRRRRSTDSLLAHN